MKYDSKISFTTEEHITLICEPNSTYLGHLIVKNSSAIGIKNSLVEFLHKKEINTDCLKVIGCDGTNVNTGSSGGVIQFLEKELEMPLQWVICLLHTNELPLRHLFAKLDGRTSGPSTFSGIISAQLQSCSQLDIVSFQPIEAPIIDFNASNLGNDQAYLLQITNAVITGVANSSIQNNNPGKISNARWLTTANRILRLYISTEVPSESLQILAKFVVKVYSQSWFSIKKSFS